MKDLREPKEGEHSFSGSFSPGNCHGFRTETFSVGIFKWVKKSSGKGLKRSAVVFRVKGLVSEEEEVYETATRICKYMDSGDWTKSNKSITI